MATDSITQNSNILADIIERNLDQFKELPNWTTLLTALATQLQELENEAYNFISILDIKNQSGETLNRIGKLVGEERPITGLASTDDTYYKLLIYARIAANSSRSRRSDIIAIITALGGSGIYMQDIYPATIQINYTGIDNTFLNPTDVLEILESATAPISINISSYESVDYFGFAGDTLAGGFGIGKIGSSL